MVSEIGETRFRSAPAARSAMVRAKSSLGLPTPPRTRPPHMLRGQGSGGIDQLRQCGKVARVASRSEECGDLQGDGEGLPSREAIEDRCECGLVVADHPLGEVDRRGSDCRGGQVRRTAAGRPAPRRGGSRREAEVAKLDGVSRRGVFEPGLKHRTLRAHRGIWG